MTNPPRAISVRDAYFLAYLPASMGPPLVIRGILEFVSGGPSREALSHQLEFATKMLKLSDLKVQGTYPLLHETATEAGLHIDEEPKTANSYESFLQSVRAVVQRAVAAQQDPVVSAAYAAGAASGDMELSFYVGRTLFYLRTGAPNDAMLATAAGNVARTLFAAQKRLVEALRQPVWPTAIREIAQKLAALFGNPPDPAQVQSTQTHAEYSEWAGRVMALLDELGVTIARS